MLGCRLSSVHVLERRQVVPFELESAFAFFAEARNLERITPPWLRFEILDAPERLERGAILRYRLRLYGVPVRWRTEIVEWTPPRGFVDVQRRGPYRTEQVVTEMRRARVERLRRTG